MYKNNRSRVTFQAWKGQVVVSETSTVQIKNDSSNTHSFQVTHDEGISKLKLQQANKKLSKTRENGDNKALCTQRKIHFNEICKKGQNNSKQKKYHLPLDKQNKKAVLDQKRSFQAIKTKPNFSKFRNAELQSKKLNDNRNLNKSSQICLQASTTHNNNKNNKNIALNRYKKAMILARTHLMIKLLTRYFKYWIKEIQNESQKILCVRIILSVYFQTILEGSINLPFFNIILGRHFEFYF